MKHPNAWAQLIAWIAVLALAPSALFAQDVMGKTGIAGAGSTFVYPILSRWSMQYRAAQARGGEYPGAGSGLDDPPASSALDYEPVGSLAGTLRIKARQVDFAVSEAPMPSEELVRSGLGQFPIVIGGIVAAVNLEGVTSGQIRFTGPVLAEIFMGTITRWSDDRIRQLNPDLKLPNTQIAVVHRSDGSGTTYNFTQYLASVSPAWSKAVGSGLLVTWPVGAGAKGNDGVAQAIARTPNSIGYVEYAQATQSALAMAQLQNRSGKFVPPRPATFQAAAASADWIHTQDFHLLLTNVPGEGSYPIVATVFVLVPTSAAATQTGATLEFFRWALERGSKEASNLGYVPLPAPLIEQVKKYWALKFGMTS